MIKILKKLTTLEWVLIAIILGVTITQVYLELLLPDYMGEIVAKIQGLISGQTVTVYDIWMVGLTMLGIVAASIVMTIVTSYLAAYVSAKLAKRLRRETFTKVSDFSMEEMNKFSTPSLITRTSNDITQVQQVAGMMFRMALYAPTMAIFAVVKILGKSSELSLVTGGAIVLMLVLVLVMFLAVVPKFKSIQRYTDKINGVTRENLTGLRVIRAYSAENYQKDKFEDVNQNLTKTNLYVNRVSSIMNPGMSLIMNGLALSIVWIGAYLVNANPSFYPTMTTFTQYAMQILMSFMFISMLFVFIPRGQVSATRILEVLNTKNKIVDGAVDIESEIKGEVEFRNVSFKYPDAEGYVLKNISFKAKKGETVAFIGSTGSGKSTLINLIPRFYDATEGEVLVDGFNVKDYKLEVLNQKLGYVPQQGVLFSGTIEENIKYGNDNADDNAVLSALETAQAGFAFELEDKTKHHISQGGKNVSGGQKQRLSIARAIVRNPEIFIFDDSFSALDYKTDKELRNALKEKTQDATTFIVAQRIGTIIDADKIIVLDSGNMVGYGTHKELLENCEIYREIALSQLSKEELANG